MKRISHKKEKNIRKQQNKIKHQKEYERLFSLIDSLKENKKNIIDNKENMVEVEAKESPTKKNLNMQIKEKNKYNYIITSNITTDKSILNQFICLECYSTNLVEESKNEETQLYADKNLKCHFCRKITPQICIKDKMLAKANLKMCKTRNIYEERAYQILKETSKSKQKIKKYYKG